MDFVVLVIISASLIGVWHWGLMRLDRAHARKHEALLKVRRG